MSLTIEQLKDYGTIKDIQRRVRIIERLLKATDEKDKRIEELEALAVEPCKIRHEFSSRVCRRGTLGCEIEHLGEVK